MSTDLFSQLRINSKLLAQELVSRGILVELLDGTSQTLQATLHTHREFFVDIDSSISPLASCFIADRKSLAKIILERASILVPRGRRFFQDEIEEAALYTDSLVAPVVVKPDIGSGGRYVQLPLCGGTEVKEAINFLYRAEPGPCPVLVEEYCAGEAIRLFITTRGNFAALLSEPAFVIGDGMNSIEVLAAQESERRLNPRINCSGEIVLDRFSERFLTCSGLNLDTILPIGQKVFVRPNSNASTGGTVLDITEELHPSFIALAKQVLNIFPRLQYAGIDIIAYDYRKSVDEQSARVIEVNTLPGLGMHMAPSKGTSRNVAAMIVDLVFPETANGP